MMEETNFGGMGGAGQQSSSLKGKLLALEQQINQLQEDMNFHKKEV